jgi:hypothetical protein
MVFSKGVEIEPGLHSLVRHCLAVKCWDVENFAARVEANVSGVLFIFSEVENHLDLSLGSDVIDESALATAPLPMASTPPPSISETYSFLPPS